MHVILFNIIDMIYIYRSTLYTVCMTIYVDVRTYVGTETGNFLGYIFGFWTDLPRQTGSVV